MKHLLLLFVFLLLSCEDSPEPMVTLVGYESGDYRVYDVILEKYAIGSMPKKMAFQSKEIIMQIAHHQSYQLIEQDIYTRADSTQEWQFAHKQTLKLYPDKLIRQSPEGLFQDLSLPAIKDNKWDVELLTANGSGTKAKYSEVNGSFESNKKQYQNCVVVLIHNVSSLINIRKQQDVYAPSYGLIYRENTDLNYCQSSPDCIGKNIIEFGYREIYSLKTIGKR